MGNSVSRTPHWPCWDFSELRSGLGLFCSTFLPSFSQGRPASQSDGSHPLLATSPFPLRDNSLNYFLDILSWPLLFGGPRLTQISPFPCKLLLLIFRPVIFIHMLSCSSNSSFFLFQCSTLLYENDHKLFSSFRLDGYLGCYLFLAIMGKASVNKLGLVFWWHLFLCSGMVSGCLVLVDTSKQFSKVIVPIYFPMLTKCLLNEWAQPRRVFLELTLSLSLLWLNTHTYTHTRTRFSVVPHCYNLQILNLQVVQGPTCHPCVILQFHCLSQPALSTHHQHL